MAPLATRRWGPRAGQSGAATLVVVMLLFFVVSLAAAYAGRNLVFEQRTSANQYRYTQGYEAAEAGVEWAIAMLNAGRVDDSCLPTTDTSMATFRQRYLSIDTGSGATSGHVTPTLRSDGTTSLWAACVNDGTTWNCDCPTDAEPTPVLPTTAGPHPAFSVRFRRVAANAATAPSDPGVIRIEVNGCSEWSTECAFASRSGSYQFCGTTLCAMLGLYSAAKTTPAVAITSKGTVAGTLTVNDSRTGQAGALAIRSGDTIDTTSMSLNVSSAPGTPNSAKVYELDPALGAGLPVDGPGCMYCLFTGATGLWPTAYRDQPAALRIDCSISCTSTTLATAAQLNPGRILWLEGAGGASIDSAGDIGSATNPVMLVVEGPFQLNNASANVYGVVYVGLHPSAVPGATLSAGAIHGALYSASVVGGTGGEVNFDEDVLRALRLASGSFVRIAGSWRDF